MKKGDVLTLNWWSIQFENLLTTPQFFNKSNVSNRNADSCTVLKLCFVEFEKKRCYNSQVDPFYKCLPILNRSSIRAENLLITLGVFKKSSASNLSANSCATLKLYFIEFEKRRCFNSQMTLFCGFLSILNQSSIRSETLFITLTQCEVMCRFVVVFRWFWKKAMFQFSNGTFSYFPVYPKRFEYPIWKFAYNTRKLQGI